MTAGLLPFSGAHWVDNVARHATARPHAPALRFEGATITWLALQDRVTHLAAALAGSGVASGDRVAILMTNRPEFIETVLAANTLGAIAVPVNFRLAIGEVAYVLADTGALIVVTDPGLAPLAKAACDQADPSPSILITGSGGGYEAGIAAAAAAAAAAAVDAPATAPSGTRPGAQITERDVALIMYTSGTTGRPKGAMLTHLNLLMQAISAIRTSRLFGDDGVALCNVPLFHIAGVGGLPQSMLLGTPTVLMPTAPFDAGTTLDVIESEGVTGLFLVPAQWQALCAHPDATSRTASLRTISWGAAPATVHLLEAMARTFPHAEIVSVFGQTEMSPVTTSLAPEEAIRKIGSVGKPIRTIAARVVDDSGDDVAPGTVGEIVYRGPTLMAGYWGKAEETMAACDGGWFHSGDLVRVDDDGYAFVVDRKKDMIISGGENIYCAEVENAIAGHPAVADVAVVGARHPRWGETPVAVVVPVDAASPPTLEDITGWTAERLASYKKPTGLVVVGELPRNASGKVLKHELRAQFGDAPTEA